MRSSDKNASDSPYYIREGLIGSIQPAQMPPYLRSHAPHTTRARRNRLESLNANDSALATQRNTMLGNHRAFISLYSVYTFSALRRAFIGTPL